MTPPVGTFCLVLHTHLPWLVHHGTWPVGEEWLHQSWAAAYQPVMRLLGRLAEAGRTEQLTLGVTPILAAQLDDPHALSAHHTWLADWQLRADGVAVRGRPGDGALGRREHQAAAVELADFADNWISGGSAVLRALVDSGVVELLGGPATHPFQPLLDERLVAAGLGIGLADATLRTGRRPAGIWAPECAYRPGLEDLYQAAGVTHFLVDGPNLLGSGADPGAAWWVGDSDVVAFGRDLEVAYRVWSPRRGYPGNAWYRDFHTFDHESGLHPARVTGTRTPAAAKHPYDPERAAARVRRDARDFVDVVRRRLLAQARPDGPALVVAAYDTELFGHWWHEGPAWLDQVLQLLPQAGVSVRTLSGAIEAHVRGRVRLKAGSWGSGKDWRVWTGGPVAYVVERNRDLQSRVLAALADPRRPAGRHAVADQLVSDLLLALASDWAFMITKDSAADYAHRRIAFHGSDVDRLLGLVARRGWDHPATLAEAAAQRRINGPFGHLDARMLARQ